MKLLAHTLLCVGVIILVQLPFVELEAAVLVEHFLSAALSLLIGLGILTRKKFGWYAGFPLLFLSLVHFIREAGFQAHQEGGILLSGTLVVTALLTTGCLVIWWSSRRPYFISP